MLKAMLTSDHHFLVLPIYCDKVNNDPRSLSTDAHSDTVRNTLVHKTKFGCYERLLTVENLFKEALCEMLSPAP